VRHLEAVRRQDFTVGRDLNQENKRVRCNELRDFIENSKRKILGVIDELNKKDVDYANLIKYLDTEEKERENENYRTFALGENGFLLILDEARDILDILDENSDALDQIEGFSTRQRLSRLTVNEGNGQTPNAIRLPEIRLPTFSGKLEEYRPFIEEFKCAVDEQSISEKRKLQYLFGSLVGEPKEMARQYPLEGQNYKIVLDLLEKHFGDKSNIKSALHASLRRMPWASKYVPEIRHTLRKIEAIVNQLTNLGENINNEQLFLEVESKMPKWVLTEIYKKKRNTIGWTLKKMLEFLDNLLKLEEDVFRAHKDLEKEKYETQTFIKPEWQRNLKYGNIKNKNFRYNFQNQWNNNNRNMAQKSTAMYAITEKRNFNLCIFCGGKHWENKCDKYPDVEKRFERARELKICFKCLKNSHKSGQCDKLRPCFYCKENHNSAFCRQTKGIIKERTISNDERNKKNEFNLKKGKNILQIKEISENVDNISSDVLINCLHKNSKNKSFETILPIKNAKIANPKNPEITENSFIFLDSGSEICLIKNFLAKKLGLEPIGKNEFRAIGVFGQSVTKEMPIFNFNIIGKNEEIIKVRARGVEENFIDELKTISLEKIDQNILNREKIPAKYLEEIIPEVLIGGSAYNNIMGFELLKNGFSKINTKIGEILSGKGKISKGKNCSRILTLGADKWWELESYGITDNPMNEDDKNALELFQKSVTRNSEGRYEIEFPFKNENPKISENFAPCIKRLQSVWSKGKRKFNRKIKRKFFRAKEKRSNRRMFKK